MAHGEHLRILTGGRFDHAIDCGDRTVLHLAMPSGGGLPLVKRSLLADFTRGSERVEYVRHAERTHPVRMVVSRAFSKLGDTAAWAMFPTALHFVAWCLTGQAPLAHGERERAEPPTAAPAEVAVAKVATAVAPAEKKAAPAAKAAVPAVVRPVAKAKAKPKAAAKPAAKAGKKPVPKVARPAQKGSRGTAARAKGSPKKAGRAAAKVARKPLPKKKPAKKKR